MNDRGSLCGCGKNRVICECDREYESRPCCWACEHRDLPPDVRPQSHSPAVSG